MIRLSKDGKEQHPGAQSPGFPAPVLTLSAAVREANARGRKPSGILLGALGILLLCAGTARAQSDVSDRVNAPAPLAGETYLGTHVGYSFIGKYETIYCPCETDQNDFLFVGGRLGHFLTDHFALEATGQYFNPDRARIHDFWELTLGGLYDFTPTYHGWNTYVGLGAGASRSRATTTSPLDSRRAMASAASWSRTLRTSTSSPTSAC
jgi:hypothetical protein